MAAATAMMPATTNPLKRVKFCDDHLVEVFQMPYDFEVSRSLLFYSPQEILKFQDERFEEEAAALEQKRLEEAEARKAEKAEKKKQRKERLQAKREARKKKQEEPSSTESTPTASRSKSRRTKDTTDATIPTPTSTTDATSSRVPVISSDDDLMSSSSESEELTLPQELPQTPVKSPQRPFPNMDLDVQSPCARRHSFPKNIAALAEAVAKATEEVNEADASAGGARVVTPSPQKRAANKKQQKYRRSAQSDLSSVSCKLHLPLPNLSHSSPLALNRAASAPTSNSSIPTPKTSLPRDRSPIRAQNHSITVNTIEEEPKEQENTPPGEDKGETVEDETENVMEPLLPRPSNNTASTAETTDTEAAALTVPPASSTTTVEDTYSQDVLQRNLQRWKQSTLFLFGLLVLSWIYFSFGASATTTGPSGTTPPSPPPSLGLRASVAAASNTANPLLLDLKPTATVNQRR